MKKYLLIFVIILVLTIVPDLSVYAQSDNSKIELYYIDDTIGLDDNILETENENNTDLDGTKEPGSYTQVSTLFLDNYSTYYFSQLTIYLGVNHKKTCSYVALEMLLSFYDTYWNDNIIDDKYEEQVYFDRSIGINDFIYGPGTKSEINELEGLKDSYGLGANDTLTDDVYNQFILDYCSTYFHLELIRIGQQYLENSYMTSEADRENLLEYYLFTERGFNSSNVSIEYPNCGENIREYIINKVKRGIPVLVGANNSTGGIGHAFIIYDYDEDEDELYCHMGWRRDRDNHNDYSHVALSDTDYVDIYSAMSLEFNTEHICSDSYICFDEDGTENKECSCYFSCHPAHQHTYEVVENAENFHVYTCNCVIENDVPVLHTYSHIDTGFDNHKKECKLCGYYISEAHDFQYESTNSSTVHKETCSKCTYEWTSEHSYQCAGKIGTTHYESCADCGYLHIGLTNGEFVQLDENSHSSACPVCSYSESIAEHRYDFRGYSSTHHEKYCIDCGYVHSRIRHSFRVENAVGNYNRCLSCGAMIYIGGNDIFPIQSKPPKDPEEETE